MAKSEAPATTTADTPRDLTGARDFDFLIGDWRVHHHVNKAGPQAPWIEFEGDCSDRPLIGGLANVEEHRFERAEGVSYGVAVRTYDSVTATWAIWWIDSRVPHLGMDPPMKGRFKDGVGTFYSDSTLDGRPIRIRFFWSVGKDGRPHWEQAYSDDGGRSWAVNWLMDFEPAAPR